MLITIGIALYEIFRWRAFTTNGGVISSFYVFLGTEIFSISNMTFTKNIFCSFFGLKEFCVTQFCCLGPCTCPYLGTELNWKQKLIKIKTLFKRHGLYTKCRDSNDIDYARMSCN